jgi:hypothetical protein
VAKVRESLFCFVRSLLSCHGRVRAIGEEPESARMQLASVSIFRNVAGENPGAGLLHNLLDPRHHRLDLLTKSIECQLL